jgi:hypothetical protein
MALDNAVSDIGIEIRRRRHILNSAYPFQIEGNRLVYQPSRTLVYEFCLAVSQSPSLNEGAFAELPVAFERLARDVLVCFLGSGAEGVRTGWPPDEFDPRPPRLKQVISSLSRRMGESTGEWKWSPEAGLPDDPEPKDRKDEGLDFVVWKAFPDGRAGRVCLLGQCACGNDYPTKFNDIEADFRTLSRWVRPMSCAWPLRVFTTPRHIPNDIYFRTVNEDAGLTLDRSRITMIAESNSAREYVVGRAKKPYGDMIRLVIGGFEDAKQVRAPRPRKEAAALRSQSHESAIARDTHQTPPGLENLAERHTPSS